MKKIFTKINSFLWIIGLMFYVSTFAQQTKKITGKILDAETLEPVPPGRLVLRYIGYFVCVLTLFIGFIWVGIDKRKQGWHDKLAGTVVILEPRETAD